jgi:hypothetical protein
VAAQGGHGRRGQDDVANLPESDEENPFQGSTVASSMSITGMSSLIA